MTTLDVKQSSSTDSSCPAISSPCFSHSPDCSPFLNWNEGELKSDGEVAAVFRSLVATLKLQPAFVVSLEGKAVKFLEYLHPHNIESTTDFLSSFASNSDESLNIFIQSIVVLISSPSPVITTAAMKFVRTLFEWCSTKTRLALGKADLIPRLINTLNLPSLSLAESVDIHANLMTTITWSLWLSTPGALSQLEVKDGDEQADVRETVLQQALVPSEKYLCHLCANRFSIIVGDQSYEYMRLLSSILEITPYHQPIMDFVLLMPVFLAVPSCLAFFEHDASIDSFLYLMIASQDKWNRKREAVQQTVKTVHRILRLEGIEDVMEAKLQNDKDTTCGRSIVDESTQLNDLLGMNIPRRG
ncbi:hypothetical protein BLNAU_17270 [Blattamonas nauphoetae]|uniref:Uncharacterized protein n=1 Tax=Blattamonas nauphoetae TaxID=2049346 RepID=A0ABQ9X9H4_9EUKA|nr:hypothetical protein BLNAU_17270 [Blattamonas nauphoetae]